MRTQPIKIYWLERFFFLPFAFRHILHLQSFSKHLVKPIRRSITLRSLLFSRCRKGVQLLETSPHPSWYTAVITLSTCTNFLFISPQCPMADSPFIGSLYNLTSCKQSRRELYFRQSPFPWIRWKVQLWEKLPSSNDKSNAPIIHPSTFNSF